MKKWMFALFIALVSSAQAATLTDFTRTAGQYWSDVKLFGKPAFKARVTQLVGAVYYSRLQTNLEVSGPIGLDPSQTIFYLSGNRAHLGDSEMGIVVYDAKRDALLVMIKTNKRMLTFEEEDLVNTAKYPQGLKEAIRAFYGVY